MNSLQSIKLAQYNVNQKQTSSSVARSIASLNNDASSAISHQLYARINPDDNVDAPLVALMGSQVDELMSQFSKVTDKITDLLAVKNGTMSIEELHTKYPVDLVKYSSDLA